MAKNLTLIRYTNRRSKSKNSRRAAAKPLPFSAPPL
jgi:hypothetical protein